MSQDHNKKSLRQFQCRDYLWEIFEQMGGELECSTDYLVNEAMRQYARSRNWGARGGRPSNPGGMPAPMSQAGSASGVGRPAAPASPRASQPGLQSGSHAQTGPLATTPNRPGAAPVPVRSPTLGGVGSRPGSAAPIPGRPAATSTGSLPPPLPGASSPSGAAGAGRMPSLFVIFNGQKVPVNKEEFVIGRGSKTADLPIKDGNISRRHAAVVLQNGAFYMKDLGSTNGVEFNGERVDTRRIEEGDVYQMCDYELRFTYR